MEHTGQLEDKALKNFPDFYQLLFQEMMFSNIVFCVQYDDKVPLDYKIFDINKSAEILFGIKKEDALGKSYTDLNLLMTKDSFFEKSKEALVSGKQMKFDFFYEPLDKYFEVFLFGTDKDKMIMLYNDVTASRKSEEKTKNLNILLEEKIDKKTKELKDINIETEALIYTISHDIRAPLRAISGFSNIILEDSKDDLSLENQRYIHKVIEAASKMGSMIEDILDLSKLRIKEMIYESLNISDLIFAVCDQLKKSNPDREVEFVIQKDVEIYADKNLIKIVIENLLGNAWKFTGKNLNAVIQFGTIKENNKEVYYIKDNGAGFDMDYSNKLFGTFQRLHTDMEFEGNGIGLALVKRIINLHAGEVWAESKIGKGSTFFFSL